MKRSLGKLILSLTIATTLLLAMSITSLASSVTTSWNFKNSSFKDLGTITSTRTVDDLQLIATSAKPMTVKENSATVDGTDYTYALSLGGSGNTSYRAVKVPVGSETTIKVTLKSSGSSSRSLVIADSSGNQITTLTAGTTASTQQYKYTGNSGYVYLYSSDSNIDIYKIQTDVYSDDSSNSSSGSTSVTSSWNFKDSDLKGLGTISSSTTVNGLGLNATSAKTMTVKENSATVNDTDYTYALSLGGSGNTSYRSVKVPVGSESTIKVTLKSSGDSSRSLAIADSSGNQITTLTAGTTASTQQYSYSGSSGYVYLYSTNSNIDIYKIQVDDKSGDSGSNSGSGSGSNSIDPSDADYVVKSGGTSLSSAISSAKSGETIVVDGKVTSDKVELPAGVNIIGINNGTIDFSETTGSSGRGITVSSNGSTIQDLTIINASDNGIFVSGSNNTFINIDTSYNGDTGIQVSNGGSYNAFYNCYSHHNADDGGGNADGFAVKLGSGAGNYFEDCIAEYNSDDGWDFYAAHGAVTLVRCQANYNGDNGSGITGDGNGFKVGGIDNKTDPDNPVAVAVDHVLIDCIAIGNTRNGYDRNNQTGVVTMTNCIADSNENKNFHFPASGTPSALGYKITFANAILDSCTSINGSNTTSGITFTGNCTGF